MPVPEKRKNVFNRVFEIGGKWWDLPVKIGKSREGKVYKVYKGYRDSV